MATSNPADFKVKNGLVVNTTASFLSTITSISTTTGGVRVSGGIGVAKDIWVGGTINVRSTTSATNTSTGALQVVGGVGIQGDLYARNLYSNGILIGTSAGTATTSTNIAGGTAGQIPYQTGPSLTSFFGPGTAGNVLVSNGTSAPAYQNTLTLTGTTAASSTTTGALQVVGGVGIGGGLYAGGAITSTNGSYQITVVPASNGPQLQFGTPANPNAYYTWGAFGNRNNLDSTNRDYYINFTGGFGTGAFTITAATGVVTLGSTTTSASTTTGALVVPGGVGIGGNLYVGGEIVASKLTIQLTTVTTTLVNTDDIISTYNTTPVNSTNTGALRIGGGIGVAGGGFFGGIVTATTFVGNLTGTATNATTATTLGGGTAMSLPYQSAANTTAFLAAGSSGQILQTNGTGSAPTWVSVSGLSAGNASTATNIAGGTAGQVPYQASPGITSFFGPGTAGNILVSNGTSAPAYQSTLTLAGITTSSSTNTGALQVVGGAGIGGNLNVGGTVTIGSGAASVASSNGDLTLIAVGGNVTTTNVVIISNTTSVNSTVTGALRIAGGVGVGGGGFFGGLVTATNFFVGPWAVSTASALTIQSNGVSQGTAGTLNFTSGTAVAVTGSIATVWVNTNTLMTTAVNLNGGVQYQIPYQQSTGTTVFILPPPTSQNSLLQFTVGTGFTWTNTTTVGGGTFFYSPIVDTFTSAGTTTTYALSTAPVNKNILTVVVDGVTQLQSAFSLSSNNLIFSEIPYNGANIDVHYANVLSTSTIPAAGLPGQILYNWNGATSGTTLMSYNSSTGVVAITGTTAATTTQTGALTITGGVGVGGDLYVGGEIVANKLTIQLTTVTTTLVTTDDIISTYNTTPTNSTNTGALRIGGGAGIAGSVYVGGNVTATTFFGAMSASHSTGTGILGSAYNGSVAQTWSLDTSTLMARTVNLAGGTANQFAYQTAPGVTAFVSTGSMYVNRATIADSASGSSSQVNTQAQTANANYYLTFVDANNATSVAETVNTTSTFYVNPSTGAVNATRYISADGSLLPNSNVGMQVSNGSTSMNFIAYTAGGSYNPTTQAGDSLIYWRGIGQGTGSLNIAPWSSTATGIRITSAGVTTIASTVSTFSTTTGALIVNGGAGIAGGLVVGGTVTATNMILNGYQVSTSSALTIQGYGTSLGPASTLNFSTGTTATVVGGVATIQALGAVVSVTGGTDTVVTTVAGAVTVWNTSTLQSITNRGSTTTNIINITNATAGSSTITGALVVAGGIGIGGNFYTAGIQRITNSTAASSTTTGALVVTGGVGIGGSLYAGNIYTNGSQVLPTNIQEITATGGQTTFTITGGYTVGSLQVFANGVNLGGGDYTASNGTTVVVNIARAGGDVMRFVSAQTSSSINNINALAIAYSVAFGG